ncbi:MAG: cobaltochelatase subunit CobN, partial [Rhizobiales bacterium]|nr:cobaltochelatase subunit CobN [Hyphomicrobiales bacterium]
GVVDALIEALARAGLNALPLFAQSFKDETAAAMAARLLETASPAITINTTGFALSTPGTDQARTLLDDGARPVLQAVMAASGKEAWAGSPRGLGARDIAMNIALPEVDGRIITRAIAFKEQARFDEATEATLIAHVPDRGRVDFVADLAGGWVRLGAARESERRVALILANYPNRDGRIGNGVGLDTPASAAALIAALDQNGYRIGDAPRSGDTLMAMLLGGPTNAVCKSDICTGETLSIDRYLDFFAGLPDAVRQAVKQRWGEVCDDPFFTGEGLRLPVHRFGNLAIAIQPARGYNIDPKATYHYPDLVPPHGYLAFHAWLRGTFEAHAIIQLGKHGNLEWLPGKALALGPECLPEAALGPVPVIYPFIVNDPGEGSQAKRRTASVIVDHLTPPMTRAETYGPLRDLEVLVDEYFEAAQVDPRRAARLKRDILECASTTGLDADCGIAGEEDADGALAKLDAHLCDLKELQIRDGLHVLGAAPDGARLDRLLVALARVPRGAGDAGDASLICALGADIGLDFDPLDADAHAPWEGLRPSFLIEVSHDPWRSHGDTIERLELLAERLVAGSVQAQLAWTATRAVLGEINDRLKPAVAQSGPAEIQAVLTALSGRFVTPGPSGAPTRGRAEVLPTGRNFYSLDSRAVPTEAAWALGERSASLLVEDFRQRNGAWPTHMALSAWGTANMRTGGDDIAQALALIGARPQWDRASGRVTGFEILPLAHLARPRVDVTLRVSGFFRDAFPAQIDLFDSAIRAIGALDENAHDNPIAAQMKIDRQGLAEAGADLETADRRAGYRVFSSMPGAYGAGLQTLIDEGLWQEREDFAKAYMRWSAFAYGGGTEGEEVPELFAHRLSHIEAVIHNQDNREHDLLDSDDYYQFEGGLSAAIEDVRGSRPVIYHNDHSRPESPKPRTLEEEIARVVRARAANPKWIAGVMRHGYKGAFEIAATVDYLYAFQATTGAVGDHHFELLFDAYLGDETVREFIGEVNPNALLDIAARFRDALARGLWHPRANRVYDLLDQIAEETGGRQS